MVGNVQCWPWSKSVLQTAEYRYPIASVWRFSLLDNSIALENSSLYVRMHYCITYILSAALVQYNTDQLLQDILSHRNPTAAGAIEHYFTNKIYYCKSQPRLVGSQVLFQQCNKRTHNGMTNFLFSDQYRIPRFQIHLCDVDMYKIFYRGIHGRSFDNKYYCWAIMVRAGHTTSPSFLLIITGLVPVGCALEKSYMLYRSNAPRTRSPCSFRANPIN